MSINLARSNVLDLKPSRLAEYYIHRASVYEALGLLDKSQEDYRKVSSADPTIIQRYIDQANHLDQLQLFEDAE